MNFLRVIAYPFSLIYGLITSVRNFLYSVNFFKSEEFKIKTIVVGNLSVGGTGKTPQIEYLIRLLQDKFKVAVLSRGYKRKSKGFIHATETTLYEEIGDEPFQYKNKFRKVDVYVDSNRVRGIHNIVKLKKQTQVILLDDAMQHRKVKAGLTILLTDFSNLYSKDFLLPTGDLRETKEGAKRAQIIVVTKCPKQLSETEQFEITRIIKPTLYQTVFFSTIEYATSIQGKNDISIKDLSQFEVLLITGIAKPKPLVEFLKDYKIKFTHIAFKDHHHFSNKNIDLINQKFNKIESKKKLILTTEKDYVRIFGKLPDVYFLPIKTSFINHQEDFDKIITTSVESSTGDC
ncbi:MAG: tetraacyldisaccharide 4'-kinase [Lutibacter sp.]